MKRVLMLLFLYVFCVSLAVAEMPKQAASCVACHGANGISVNPVWPNLAGQKKTYLANQMRAMRSGERFNAVMAPFVESLSDADIDTLSAWYAGLDSTASSNGNAELVSKGHTLRAYCLSCHGMNGNTINDEWPNLAGQHAEYLYQQLVAFKSGQRVHANMNAAVAPFSEREFRALSSYYSQLEP